ncbi:hypothetical protein BDP27DRAFT_288350 [Rhodocollybia butyracea]|uniref:Uncharacterized protein n=1 Tax=Rhodocollybia butyracea TaxID=206335 RepID=A0A9P5UB26_9AGAR|nr:hypothetical protein BDP27DRAFT_288350 [Rhodocollybia butyracea]
MMMMTSSISSQDIANIEKEQKQEDAEALKLTEEQRSTLLQSFSSVKVEFCDLDGLEWTGSALRTRAISRPSSSSNILPKLTEKLSRRARAQTLFSPASPTLASAPTSSYLSPLDTPLPSNRGFEALAVLNNVDLSPSYDEKTIRAVISPVKAAFDFQKPAASNRDEDSRPPAKQRRRSRSSDKTSFSNPPLPTKYQPADSAETPTPTYTDGVPMERQLDSKRQSLSRTYSRSDITFGVSPTVAGEVMRGRERVRGARPLPQLVDAAESCTMISEEDEIVESDLLGGGTIRFSPQLKREHGLRVQAFVRAPVSPLVKIKGGTDEEDDCLMTPTAERHRNALEFPTVSASETPVQSHRVRVDSTALKRKRQQSDGQSEADES